MSPQPQLTPYCLTITAMIGEELSRQCKVRVPHVKWSVYWSESQGNCWAKQQTEPQLLHNVTRSAPDMTGVLVLRFWRSHKGPYFPDCTFLCTWTCVLFLYADFAIHPCDPNTAFELWMNAVRLKKWSCLSGKSWNREFSSNLWLSLRTVRSPALVPPQYYIFFFPIFWFKNKQNQMI